MSRITRAAPHLSIEEVKVRMKHDPRAWCRQRWLIIYNALVDPREAGDIAKHTGVSVHTVHKLISDYNKRGVAAVETPGRGGRRHEYLTLEEERDFLQPFFEQAAKGEIATTAQIQQSFEERVGCEVDESTIYRLIDRHQWRKLVPRPFHPQADQEEQKQFGVALRKLSPAAK
jgi:transposase